MSEIQEIIDQIFSNFLHPHSKAILTFLIVSALLGFILGWLVRGGKVRRLKRALKKKEQEYKDLIVENAKLKEAFENNEESLKRKTAELEEANGHLSAYADERSLLQSDLVAVKNEIEQYHQERANYIATAESSKGEVLSLNAKIEDLKNQLEQSIDEAEQAQELKTNYNHAFNRLSQLEEKISNLEIENAGLRTELGSVRDESGELKREENSEISRIFQKLDALEAENARLRYDVKSIKDTSRTKVVKMAEGELASVKERLQQLETENKALHQELGEIKESSEIEFVDLNVNDGNPIVINEETEEEVAAIEVLPEDKATLARKAVSEAFGTKIKIATAEEKDDLKKINGIGPFIEDKLNEIGIYTYEQISQFDEELIDLVTDAIQFFPGRIFRDDWVGQATALKETA